MKHGGWTVFQRRRDGSENFYRNWADYVAGFANLKREFWLGLDHIHCLTSAAPRTELRIDLADFFGNYRHAYYDFFNVNGPSTNYILDVGYHNWTSTNYILDVGYHNWTSTNYILDVGYHNWTSTNYILDVGYHNWTSTNYILDVGYHNWTSTNYILDVGYHNWTSTNYILDVGYHNWTSTNYILDVGYHNWTSTVQDRLTYHNGMQFTTKDRDNDQRSSNCASNSYYYGAWWYKSCEHSNLNGQYRYGTSSWGTMCWHPLAHGKQDAMKFTEMKLRPRD